MITGTSMKQKKVKIRVGRNSVLGNPFYMGKESERESVCEGYTKYFAKVVYENIDPLEAAKSIPLKRSLAWKPPTREEFMELLVAIEEKAKTCLVVLECYCYPRQCHIDTLLEYFAR